MKKTNTESSINIYNKPLKSAVIISVFIIVFLFVLAFCYITEPFTVSEYGFYKGLAAVADIINIVLGYILLLFTFGLTLYDFYLSYGALHSDRPKIAKVTLVFSLLASAAAVGLNFWFTATVVNAYRATVVFF